MLDDGRWTTDDRRRTTDDGRWTTDDRRRTTDESQTYYRSIKHYLKLKDSYVFRIRPSSVVRRRSSIVPSSVVGRPSSVVHRSVVTDAAPLLLHISPPIHPQTILLHKRQKHFRSSVFCSVFHPNHSRRCWEGNFYFPIILLPSDQKF